jgi:phosphotransferase system enzyme I (PtsI)
MNRTGTRTVELRLHGRAASAGCARGRIHIQPVARETEGSAAAAVDLPAAIHIALAELRSLQRAAGQTAAEILQFQIELLEDPELTSGAFAAIREGAAADVAFRAVMDEHLRAYESPAPTYQQERAVDVRDVRDRVLRAFSGKAEARLALPDEECLLIAEDLTPSAFVQLDLRHVKGVATRGGSPMSHVAMLARAREIPLIVGLQDVDPGLDGREALLDGDEGCLVVDPGESSLRAWRQRGAARSARVRAEQAEASVPALKPDGQRVAVYLNVDSASALAQAPAEWFDGIGLARTELLLDCSAGMPGEAEQVAVYSRLFDWSAGRPTTIRLLDAGGDKPVPGITLAGEVNPFLGVRGVRALLRHPEALRAQLRAIVAAARGRAVRILVPMVTIPGEMVRVQLELRRVLRELGGEGEAIQLGMMVETPAAALTIEQFAAADFFSIGTNDLLQYLMAASRDRAELEHLHAPTGAALLEAVRRIVRFGERSGREVSVCGDAAADLEGLDALVRAGVTAVSVPAHRAPAVKAAIRAMSSPS